jgi:hypothetical protein
MMMMITSDKCLPSKSVEPGPEKLEYLEEGIAEGSRH